MEVEALYYQIWFFKWNRNSEFYVKLMANQCTHTNRHSPCRAVVPNLLAPGTCFVEEKFWWTERVVEGWDGSGGNVKWWGFCLLTHRSPPLLCGPVLNRPWTGTSLQSRDWGPLIQVIIDGHVPMSRLQSSGHLHTNFRLFPKSSHFSPRPTVEGLMEREV